jgi:hypothetical protein
MSELKEKKDMYIENEVRESKFSDKTLIKLDILLQCAF